MGVGWTAIVAAELAVGAKAGGGGSGGIGQMMFVFYAYSIELNRIIVCMIAVGLVALLLDRMLRAMMRETDAMGAPMSARRRSCASTASASASRSRGAPDTVAVDDLSLDVRQGEFLVIVGPSGCGKTTVLNVLAGLDTPTSGTVAIDDRIITGPGPDRGVMFQDYALFPWQTVRGNVEFGLRYGPAGAGLDREARDERVRRTIDLVGLTGSETQVSASAVGRHAPARRARAADRQRARGAADGRAARGARRADAHHPAGRAAAHLGTGPPAGRSAAPWSSSRTRSTRPCSSPIASR